MSNDDDDVDLLDAVFYVDELKEDFTFYLDAAVHAKSVKEIRSLFAANESKDEIRRKFSLSDQIKFINLNPHSSLEVSSDLWTRVRAPTDPGGHYLLGKLKSVIVTAEDKELIETLEDNENLSKKTQAGLAKLLTRALSPANCSDIATQSWLPPTPESQLRNAVTRDERAVTRELILHAFHEIVWREHVGRALICLSHVGQRLSITVRELKSKGGYEPKSLREDQQHIRQQWLFSVKEYCQSIYNQIFRENESGRAHGLLVVTGPTKSLKSEITRGLIHRYLDNASERAIKNNDRRPHLVTFEDPIEVFYARDAAGHATNSPFVALPNDAHEIDYTPRQKPKDADFLRDALTDALRQTPAVFFVGESRSKEEWEVLLDFAATGHLVVTTAHAGSLVEAMHKIFEAREVKTAADRGEVANKLLAVVNLKPGKVEIKKEPSTETEVVFPALWKRTSRGVASLTCDGLSALLPERQSAEQPSCLGRRWFIEELIKQIKPNLADAFPEPLSHTEVAYAACKQAANWDLQGV